MSDRLDQDRGLLAAGVVAVLLVCAGAFYLLEAGGPPPAPPGGPGASTLRTTATESPAAATGSDADGARQPVDRPPAPTTPTAPGNDLAAAGAEHVERPVVGFVVDTDGQPVVGADIRGCLMRQEVVAGVVYNQGIGEDRSLGTSAAGGYFRVTVAGTFPAGGRRLVRLRARRPGCTGSSWFDLDLTRHLPNDPVRLVVYGAGSIHGQVLDDRGYPVAGAFVTILDRQGTPEHGAFELVDEWQDLEADPDAIVTDATGHWQVSGVAEGRYTAEAKARGYRATGAPAVAFEVAPGGAARVDDLRLQVVTAVQARLVDERRQPIRANLWYEFLAPAGAVLRRGGDRTDRSGLVILAVPDGARSCRLWVDGYDKPAPRPLHPTPGHRSDLGILTLRKARPPR